VAVSLPAMPMLLAIGWFRLTFPEAREGPIAAFHGNSNAATRQTRGGVTRHHLGRPQVCGSRVVAHRLAHLLAFPLPACGFRRLRLHVPRLPEIRERRVAAVGSRARSVNMTKCGREKPPPRQYSRGRTPASP
jgi:hypothetical protein